MSEKGHKPKDDSVLSVTNGRIALRPECEYESCVVCGKMSDQIKSKPIEFRDHYIEGVGQLCSECGVSISYRK